MAGVALREMTACEFLEWCSHREDERYELVDGIPVLKAGETDRHGQIVVNLIAGLAMRLRGGPCRTHTADFAMLTAKGANVRRPDVLVDCKPGKGSDLAAGEPTAAFEVLSPSNANFTRFSKVDEYKAVPTLRHIVVLDSDAARLVLYNRAANAAWTSETIEGEGAVLPLADLGVELPLAEIYAEVSFEARAED